MKILHGTFVHWERILKYSNELNYSDELICSNKLIFGNKLECSNDLKCSSESKCSNVLKYCNVLKYSNKGSAGILSGIILTLLILVAIFMVMLLTPLCNIKNIKVITDTRYEDSDIIKSSGIKAGENGFKKMLGNVDGLLEFRLTEAEKSIIKGRPYIENVKVKFGFDGTVNISVYERKALFYLKAGQGQAYATGVSAQSAYIIIDKSGIVLELSDNKPEKLFYLIGLEYKNFRPGEKLPVKNPDKFRELETILNTIRNTDNESQYNKIMPLLISADINEQGRYKLFLGKEMTVILGKDENLEYNIQYLREIMKQGYNKGVLDFTKEERPVLTQQDLK